MAGILIQVNADNTCWAGLTQADSAEEAQTQLDNDGDTENGTRLASFIPFNEDDPAVRTLRALLETANTGQVWEELERSLTAIFEAGRAQNSKQ